MKGSSDNSKKRSTLSKHLTISTVILVTILLIAILISVYSLIKNVITRNSNESIISESKTYELEIENWSSTILAKLNSMLKTMQGHEFTRDDDVLFKYLQYVSYDIDPAIPDGMYVGDASNRYIDPSGWQIPDDYIVAERDWYKEGIAHDKMSFGAPYVGSNNNELMISATATIYDDTVASCDVLLKSIIELVDQMDIIGDGFGFIIDPSTGYVIAHPTDELAGQPIDNIDDPLVNSAYSNYANTDDLTHLTANNTDYILKLSKIDSTGWILVTCAQTDVIYANLNRTTIILLISTLLLLAIVTFIFNWLIRSSTRTLTLLTGTISQITDGDFSTLATVTGNDEITTMSEALNIFITRMQGIIRTLSNISDSLNIAANNTSAAANDMTDATANQTTSMGQLNETVDELAKSIEEIAQNATSLANTISDVSDTSNAAIETMNNTVKYANTGRQDIAQVSDKIQNIDSVIKELDLLVSDVGKSTDEINNITTIIGDIADQTNLLSLNASIEAARAGEAGKGFAVVATEIGGLASMCSDAVNKISSLIQNINHQVQAVIDKTSLSVKDVETSLDIVTATNDTFINIYNNVEDTNARLIQVNEMILKVDEVATNMAAITEEQSASTHVIIETSEALYLQSQHISENSNSVKETSDGLKKNADDIRQKMSIFHV